MRECWVNVYVSKSGRHVLGAHQPSLSSALVAGHNVRRCGAAAPAYRLHVRPKPRLETQEQRWDRLEDDAIDLIDTGDEAKVRDGHQRLRMIEAARIKARH